MYGIAIIYCDSESLITILRLRFEGRVFHHLSRDGCLFEQVIFIENIHIMEQFLFLVMREDTSLDTPFSVSICKFIILKLYNDPYFDHQHLMDNHILHVRLTKLFMV